MRPKEKLRGVKRRIRTLENWPNDFRSWFPTDARFGFWNCKIPVLDRLVSPKFTNQSIQVRAVNALVQSVENIRNARSAQDTDSIVAGIVTYPDMFNSELCVFFDKTHFHKFFKRSTPSQSLLPTKTDSLCKRFGFVVPEGFVETGYDFSFLNDDDVWEYSQWWIYTDES